MATVRSFEATPVPPHSCPIWQFARKPLILFTIIEDAKPFNLRHGILAGLQKVGKLPGNPAASFTVIFGHFNSFSLKASCTLK